MKNTLRCLAIATMATLAPGNLLAQETAPPPTPQQVLEGLSEGRYSRSDAIAFLTQQHERRPRSELDAFADGLVALAIAGNDEIRSSALLAQWALIDSSNPEEPGAIPYAGAYDALHKIFRGTQSSLVLGDMIDVDLRRGKEIVRALFARHGDDACTADMALRHTRHGDEIAKELGLELESWWWDPHYCLLKYHDYHYLEVLAQLREGKAEGTDRAVDILTQRASGYAVYISVLSDSLMEMVASSGGTSDLARRALAVFERSARPVHADAKPYTYAYGTVATIFQITESQAALESLVEIDAARAREFLTELAQRNGAVACTARAVLAGTTDGPRLLRDLEGRGALTYQCDRGRSAYEHASSTTRWTRRAPENASTASSRR